MVKIVGLVQSVRLFLGNDGLARCERVMLGTSKKVESVVVRYLERPANKLVMLVKNYGL